MEIQAFVSLINSTAALIAAIGTLLAGIVAVYKSVPVTKLRSIRSRLWSGSVRAKARGPEQETNTRGSKQETNGGSGSSKVISRVPAVLGMILIVFSSSVLVLRTTLAQAAPVNEQLTTAAWKHFEAKEFDKAIEKARECIELFSGEAEIDQERLTKEKVPLPNPQPKNEKEKQETHARGLINDVAVSYFIVGKSYEALQKKEDAIQAYREAEKFSHAMAWDAQGGWFWSVSKAAAGRVRYLEKSKGGT